MRQVAVDPRRLVDELVYQRVRLDADRLAMADLERELATSLRRALSEVDATEEELDAMIDRAIARGLWRVADEIAAESARDPATDCPLCEAPLVCPAG